MNVTFHVLTGITVATLLSPHKPEVRTSALLAGFGTTVVFHGVLDYLPHSYPIKSIVDVALALLVFGAVSFLAKPHIRLLLAVCFLGSIFPDLIDLAPGILNRHLGLELMEVKYFPWHWKQYSGSIYDGSRDTESSVYHLLVLAAAAFSIWRRHDLFGSAESTGEMRRDGRFPSGRHF